MADHAIREAPRGVHLVGSTPFKSATEHFMSIGSRLGSHILSITDGESEPPLRSDWASCLVYAFKHVPWILRPDLQALAEREREIFGLGHSSATDLSVLLKDLHIGYDTWAITSYTTFKTLKQQGHIPEHLKFQVGLPTITSACLFVIKPQYRQSVETYYQEALTRALRNIQDHVPHDELVIQFETVAEIWLLENAWKRPNAYGMGDAFAPWFGDSDEQIRHGVFERLDRLISSSMVDEDVALGLHICYGDSNHTHFMEPSSTDHIATIAERLALSGKRPSQYVHFPVPKDRDDDLYLRPMGMLWPKLQTSGIYLYVGLIHGNDLEGTRKRIVAAKSIFGSRGWGIANECGLCRTPEPDFESSLSICTSMAKSRF